MQNTSKRNLLGWLVFILGIAATVSMIWSIKPSKKTDLVDGITPVERWEQARLQVLNQLCGKPATEQQQFIEKNWPTMANDVIVRVRSNGNITDSTQIDSVKVGCGSCESAKALDSAGTWHEGQFSGRPIFFIYHDGAKKPKTILLQCGNGMMADCDITPSFGLPMQTAFSIKPGEGLCHHVGWQEALQIAASFELPLTKGKGISGEKVSPQQARRINTDYKQVTVKVFPGDSFNLRTWQYFPAKR